MTTVTNAELKNMMTTNATTTNNNFKKIKQALGGKVDTVSGKGLSTKDFTAAMETKLSALPTNAELQSGYVAKDGTKVLSDENFTTALKTKLEGLSSAPSVTIEQVSTPDTGMAATYQLKVGGVATGAKINVAQDKYMGTPIIKTCSTANSPISGLAVGDKYVEFPIANSTDKQYLSVQDLYNVYQAGNGITFSGKQISVDTAVVATKADLASYQTEINEIDTLSADYISDGRTNKVVTQAEKTAWNNKQDQISSTNKLSADLLSEGATVKLLTAAERTAISTISNKVDSQGVTDIINTIFGDLSITDWDDISLS